jgi:glycosyltransferase involved in cell wall biosynthesis
MRILMLSQSYAPVVGGVERVVEDLSHELQRRGHEVGVATLRQPGERPERLDNGLKVHSLSSSVYRLPGVRLDKERRHSPPLADPETIVQLRRLVRRERPDVVHAHNWLIHSYLPLDRRQDTALALSMHDYGLVCATKRFLNRGVPCSGPGPIKCIRCAAAYYSLAKGPPVAVATRLSESHVRKHVDILLPVSTAVRDLCDIGEDELHMVIPNFIRDLPPPPAREEPQLAELPERPFILYFGDVTVDKGAGVLLQAYRSLDDPPPLVLVGRCFLEEAAGTPGVKVLGALPHALTMEALRRALFTVVPSVLPEAFGLAALETAAAGKPIVASDIGGLRDVVADGESGLLVAPGDREALRSAMQRLLADAGLRERMGQAGRARARSFGPETVVPRFEEAYEAAMRARRAKSPTR